MLYGNFTIIAFWKQKPLWLIGLSPSFGKGSDGGVATEQQNALVDVTFMHMIIQKYPNSLDGHETQRHRD